jgi:dethiobiotin synthetase
MIKLFITATDTDAGKTYVAQLLVKALVQQGKKVAVYKPISAGCRIVNKQLINDDAYLLLQQSNCKQTLAEINPIAFELPIAPHIAAQKQNYEITLTQVKQGYETICQHNAEFVICEGAGGWRLPLGNGQFLSQFVQQTKQQTILVVNIKLGCLNHAILTYESMVADGVNCLGWIANCTNKSEQLTHIAENIEALKTLLPIPMLAQLFYQENHSKALVAMQNTVDHLVHLSI